MLNPHQNININISYNLATDKPQKPLPAKKVQKHIKTQPPPNTNPPDIQIKLNRKNIENNLKKSNQHRSQHQPKKQTRKKIVNVPRNTCTPDLFNQRRIKTEGPSADHQLFSAVKKQGKTKGHNKSLQQPFSRLGQSTKKSTSVSKTPKMIRTGHITSCTIPNWKKLPMELSQHVISQAGSTIPRKKRTQSAFIKNDKVVSKLLSMSILASELGSSQPITSQRRSNESSHSRTLKQYMTSMDMRIIRNMQDDVPVFMDKKQHPTQNTIRNIMRAKEISLQELTRKVIIIQRFWKTSKIRVVGQYQLIFQKIADKLGKQERISEISGIAQSPEDINQEQEHNIDNLFENEGLVSSIKRDGDSIPPNSIQSQSFNDSLHNIRWIQENDQPSGGRGEGLNIKKYRQLVSEQVQRNNYIVKSKQKEQHKEHGQQYKQQVQQWNSINKHITNIMNHKGSIDSQLLLDELIRQSKNNQYWIDNDFDHSQQRQQEKEQKEVIEQKGNSQAKHNFSQNSQLSQEGPNLHISLGDRDPPKHKFQDSLDDEEEDNLYDKNKYQVLSNQKLKTQENGPLIQKHTPQKEPAQSFSKNVMKVQIDFDTFAHPTKQQIDQVWISQQIMEDNVVRNYLDCGLDDFGINVNSRIMQMPRLAKEDGSDNQNQYNFSSDEAIGSKFEQANLAVIKNLNVQPDLQPSVQGIKLTNLQTDQMVEIIVKYLISEFASDISVILKKASGPPPQKKPPVQKIQGIPTNFNSIREYLKKFVSFICREERNMQKIVDTINKDIGPSSLEILTYLRPEPEDSNLPYNFQNQEQSFDDQEEGLFVIPAEIFQLFEAQLQEEYKAENMKQMSQRMKAYLSFWHRCIFQSFNQCLDYQRPYGIEGKPYEWTTETKVFRKVGRDRIMVHFQRAQNRLLDLTMLVGGILFQKNDSPFFGADLSEEQKHMMNEERLSRILATELLQSEQSWINYNDEMAELLVQLSRMIEQKMFFQYGTELKKLQRRRKIIAQESAIEESVVFNMDEL